jgi:hypothetical protein
MGGDFEAVSLVLKLFVANPIRRFRAIATPGLRWNTQVRLGFARASVRRPAEMFL